MFVVTRTFRDANGVFEVGSIVDPTSVKTFRSRLQQRHIVDVDESSVAEWAEFFKNRYGIDLKDTLAEYLERDIEQKLPLEMIPTEIVVEPFEEVETEPIEAIEELMDTPTEASPEDAETPEISDMW